jgi:hypothetical protein
LAPIVAVCETLPRAHPSELHSASHSQRGTPRIGDSSARCLFVQITQACLLAGLAASDSRIEQWLVRGRDPALHRITANATTTDRTQTNKTRQTSGYSRTGRPCVRACVRACVPSAHCGCVCREPSTAARTKSSSQYCRSVHPVSLQVCSQSYPIHLACGMLNAQACLGVEPCTVMRRIRCTLSMGRGHAV